MATIFRFFDLPLELRQFVYRELTRPGLAAIPLPSCHQSDAIWGAQIDSYIEPHLLVVSKQFKEEYEQETYPNATLCIACTAWKLPVASIRSPLLPGNVFATISQVELDVFLGCWKGTKDLLREKYALLRPCSLPNLRMLSVDFGISSINLKEWFDQASGLQDISLFFSYVNTFAAACDKMYQHAKVSVSVSVREALYQPAISASLANEAPPDVFEGFQENVRKIFSNWMNYRASLSQPDDEYSFYGMHLDFEDCGDFEAEVFDELFDKAFKKSNWE